MTRVPTFHVRVAALAAAFLAPGAAVAAGGGPATTALATAPDSKACIESVQPGFPFTTYDYDQCTVNAGTGYLFTADRGRSNAIFAGATNFTGGIATVTGGDYDYPSRTNAFFSNGTVWNLTANSQLTNLTLNNSSLLFARPNVNGYNTLTVGNYTGINAAMTLNTSLGGTTSLSNELIIKGGTATGATVLTINNTGGTGAQTTGAGIPLIIATNGGSIAADAFTLSSPEILAGNYIYYLESSTTEESLVSQRVNSRCLTPQQVARLTSTSTFFYDHCTLNVGTADLFNAENGRDLAIYASASNFTGGIATDSASNTYINYNNGSIWNLTANSEITNLVVNRSSVLFAPPSVNGYNTLTVGNYIGNGAAMTFNTVLGGTTSPSDELIVNGGKATGSTVLTINNVGGTGAQTTGAGIPLIVATNGGAITANAFTLANPYIVAGNYVYTLDATATEDSLVSEPIETTGQALHSTNAVLQSRQSQTVTGLQLGLILLGANEQVNCSNCVSGFGSIGSASVGMHGRWDLTDRATLLAGVSYDEYSGKGYSVQSAPILAASLRYDLVDWGSQRPFFEIGGAVSPYGVANFSRNYATAFGDYSGYGSEIDRSASVFGRMGYVARVTPNDELAAYGDLIGSWQYSPGYAEATGASNPYSASVGSNVYAMGIGKIGAQYTHLFNGNIEVNVNGAFAHGLGPGYEATDTVAGLGPIASSTTGDLNWGEFGARVGIRLSQRLVLDAFLLGTVGPQPIGETLHGGLGLRYHF